MTEGVPSRPVPRRADALAALTVLLGVLVVGVVGGCSDDDDQGAAGEPVLDVGARPPGTCLRIEEDLPPEVTTLPVVGCDEPHTHEIYAVVSDKESDTFPGMDQLGAFAERECIRAFEPYVGISPFDSSLSFSWLVPSLDSWNDHDDRDVLCVLAAQDGQPLTRSMRGARL